ncbi:AraC family transcriptional regulator N-terminal domain-containing protein [Phaeovulum sp. W22_SRMD_FR3]|uniref:AraC family transcriptional regulator n=1 Tax=Phaeovulum sp. W22_SRMD_FR3 TaxID=3240274 RepID=UPI003F972345
MQQETLMAQVLAAADALAAGEDPAETGVPGLAIARSRAVGVMRHTLYQPVFCLVLQGEKQLMQGAQTLRLTAGQGLIVSFEMPALSHVVEASPGKPYLALAVALELDILRELAAQLPDPPGQAAPGTDVVGRLATVAPVSPPLVSAMERLFGLTAQPAAIPILAPLIRREIYYRLLTGPQGAALRDLLATEGHAARIARAITVMKRGLAERLSIADLARTAGMSVSGFHEHFRQVTAITPLQFHKNLKLLEARRLLMAGAEGVAGAAYAVGYESPTHFSREYARLFGASPQQDQRRQRRTLAAPA